jgi:hypothetical protein
MRRKIIFGLTIIVLMGSSCVRQVNQMRRFGDCEFKYISTDSVVLAGIPMTKYSILDNLSLLNLKTILNMFVKGEAPLKFKIYLQAKNNRRMKAAINQMDWELYIEDIKAIEGVNTQRVVVPGRDSTTFAVDMKMDVIKTLRIDNFNSMTDLMYSLLDVKKTGKKPVKPLRVKLMVRPSFKVGKKTYQYPRFIAVLKDYEVGSDIK